jgi:tellurite resistance protein TehA-like permease
MQSPNLIERIKSQKGTLYFAATIGVGGAASNLYALSHANNSFERCAYISGAVVSALLSMYLAYDCLKKKA